MHIKYFVNNFFFLQIFFCKGFIKTGFYLVQTKYSFHRILLFFYRFNYVRLTLEILAFTKFVLLFTKLIS